VVKRFYYEYDEIDKGYLILEDGGGYEHGAFYDISHFSVQTKEDAIDAVTLLNKLYEKAEKQ